MSMEYPRQFLALLATILRAATASALSKFSSILLPFAALVKGALPNPAPRVILAAKVTHHHSGPVLHILVHCAHRELF